MIIAAAIDFSDTSSAISRMPPAMPSTPDSMLVNTTAPTMTISINMNARALCDSAALLSRLIDEKSECPEYDASAPGMNARDDREPRNAGHAVEDRHDDGDQHAAEDLPVCSQQADRRARAL